MKSREHVVTNGKAAFYACMWPDLREAAMNCGWALGLHGSLASDMDIMAMPWVEGAKPVEEMIKALSDCFTESPFKEHHLVPHAGKPNGRVVYTMSIWGSFHLDINVIQPTPTVAPGTATPPACRSCGKPAKMWKGWELCDDCGHRHHVESRWHDPIPAPKGTEPPARPLESVQSRRAKLAMSIVNYTCENTGVPVKVRQELNDRLFAWAENQLEEYAAFRADLAATPSNPHPLTPKGGEA